MQQGPRLRMRVAAGRGLRLGCLGTGAGGLRPSSSLLNEWRKSFHITIIAV